MVETGGKSIPLTQIYMTTQIPLTQIYMTTQIPLTQIYMATQIPLTQIYMTTYFPGLVHNYTSIERGRVQLDVTRKERFTNDNSYIVYFSITYIQRVIHQHLFYVPPQGRGMHQISPMEKTTIFNKSLKLFSHKPVSGEC